MQKQTQLKNGRKKLLIKFGSSQVIAKRDVLIIGYAFGSK